MTKRSDVDFATIVKELAKDNDKIALTQGKKDGLKEIFKGLKFKHCERNDKNGIQITGMPPETRSEFFFDEKKNPVCFVPFPGLKHVTFAFDESSSSSSSSSKQKPQSEESSPPSSPVRAPNSVILDDFDYSLGMDYYDRTNFDTEKNRDWFGNNDIGAWQALENRDSNMKTYCNCLSNKFYLLSGYLDDDDQNRGVLRCMKKLRDAGEPGSATHNAYMNDSECKKVGDPFQQCRRELGEDYKGYRGITNSNKTKRCVWGQKQINNRMYHKTPRGIMMYLDTDNKLGVNTRNGKTYINFGKVRKNQKVPRGPGFDKTYAYNYLKTKRKLGDEKIGAMVQYAVPSSQ